MPSDAATRWIGLLLLVVALVGAMFFNILKLQSLSFHTRDFPFYLQFAAKALDPDLSSQYALNPQGHNFLGLGGVEGTRGIYQAIHFEPVKFVYAALHMVLPTPLSTLTFVAAVYFAPVPYLIVVYPARRAADRRWILLVVAAYVACPLSLLAISCDARPVVMLGPVFLMLVVSIHVGRPFRETIVLFVLLMLIREEALLFAGAAIAYNLARRDQADGRVGTTLQLGGIRAAWAMTTAVYFAWAGYGVGDRFNLIGSLAPALRWPVLLGVGVAGGAATVVWRYLRRHGRNSRTVWEIAAYSTIFLPFASELIQHHNDRRTFIRHDLTEALWRVVDTYVNSPQSALSFAAIVALGILLWDGVRRPVLRSSLHTGVCGPSSGRLRVHLRRTVAGGRNAGDGREAGPGDPGVRSTRND